MVEDERRKPCDILCLDWKPFNLKLFQGSVHVKRVPEHDDIDHESERAQLILLPLSVSLPQFTPFAMEKPLGPACAVPLPGSVGSASGGAWLRHLYKAR